MIIDELFKKKKKWGKTVLKHSREDPLTESKRTGHGDVGHTHSGVLPA